MPKYYCDYCDTFLTHDSPSVRKTHNGGRKHKDNVRQYYQTWMEDQAQKLVDQTARAFATNRMGGAVPRTTMGMSAMPPLPRPMGMPPLPIPGRPPFPMAFPPGPLPPGFPAAPMIPAAGLAPPGMAALLPPRGAPAPFRQM
ncbi:unnamed protein product [Caenorhabditis bovis]|uniref:U1 small nuclear ribonucleoprotein C n=1 Tax=Caenorhabditis bovis TaxID=2654633 RepID=A0A8S1EZW0_9PELO|nr:unnamed protein product [Caenorhabditis bovis]